MNGQCEGWAYPSDSEIRETTELHALAHDRAGVHVDDCSGPDCPMTTGLRSNIQLTRGAWSHSDTTADLLR